MKRPGGGSISLLVCLPWQRIGAQDVTSLVPAPETPTPFTSIPVDVLLIVLSAFAALGFLRALLPGGWRRAPFRWLRSAFAHALRVGWLSLMPALILDGLAFFMGDEYGHGWSIAILAMAFSPFAAGLQWEKSRWDPSKGREEPYPPAFNFFVGLALTALLPALLVDWILGRLWAMDPHLLGAAAAPFNLLALGAAAASVAFGAAKLGKLLLVSALLPHRLILFFIDPSSRYYALTATIPLLVMGAFHYYTIPFFLEVFSFSLPPVPSISLDQALMIILPNVITVSCVIYFSIFAGVFISMLPIILLSRSLRREPKRPPTLDELIRDPETSRRYLGRALTADEILPTIVTVTAYNEPSEPLEKTLFGYLRVVKAWLDRGLPPEKYIILFSHQTEREEERIAFEEFLAEAFPDFDPRQLIERDWSSFDEDDPSASIRDESRLERVLVAWLQRKGLSPDSKAGRDEYRKRQVCQRLYEFSCHAPRELFRLPEPPVRRYGPRVIDSWIWYYLIPRNVGGRLLQVSGKAHNLFYAREAVWGKEDSSPLRRDGVFRDAPEWLFDASDADAEIHPSCVDGILATYTPFYREPALGWIQRLSYTIEPRATFLSSIKASSETAYWSWFLRARIHTYTRRGKTLMRRVGDIDRPVRRDFQSANGHNMVVRGTSVQAAGGDVEHQVARVHAIRSPVRRWLARLRGQRVACETKSIEKWVPTGEDLELATRMALAGYYGDYAPYAPQGEGSPADFRGNVPQAIRWSGNNVQLIFMHLANVFSSKRLTFNEKMGYFVNLATLASAPLLYLTVLRAGIMPFLDIPDVYSSIHPSLGPLGFLLALAPNFLLLALALSGQLVVAPTAPWQRTVLAAWHRRLLKWIGILFVAPGSILFVAFLPGWLKAAGFEIPAESAWVLAGCAVLLNLVALVARRDAYADIAYCLVLLPFLQVLYLAWIIFGIMGTLNMIVKTQIVEPYISRITGTFHPPEAGCYPADANGRFLPLNQRFPLLLAPCRWLHANSEAGSMALAAAVGGALWLHPIPGWRPAASAAAGFLISLLWLWRRLRGLMSDWFLDRDSLINRWWDYWTNPQAAFVKTLKEREERPLTTLLKDNVFGLLNGLLVLALIVHVHFVNTADFSAALLAYLTFSIAASWVISPFFYEEPHRTLRHHGRAAFVALLLVSAFLSIPLGLPETLNEKLGINAIPSVLVPWLEGIVGVFALGALINLAPWEKARAFAKRFALAVVMLSLLFLNGLAVSYRGIAVEPIQDSWAMEADSAFTTAVREEALSAARLEDLRSDLREAERQSEIVRLRERLAFEWLKELRGENLREAIRGREVASRKQEVASRALDVELERSRFRRRAGELREIRAQAGSGEAVLDKLLEWGRREVERSAKEFHEAREKLGEYRGRLASLEESEKRTKAARSFAEFVDSYEADVVGRLRGALEETTEFVARVAVARGSPGAGAHPQSPGEFLSFQLPPMGNLAARQRQKEMLDRDLENARRFESLVRRELAGAREAFRIESARRKAALERRHFLEARYSNDLERHEDLVSRRELLRTEAAERARRVFWATPRRYESFHKSLVRYRPVLEVESSRRKLEEALQRIASLHPVKRTVLEGAPWYRKGTVLPWIRDELPAAVGALERATREYADARRYAELLLARRNRNLGLLLLAELAERGSVSPSQPSLVRKIAAIQTRRPDEPLDDEDPETAELLRAFDAGAELRHLEAVMESRASSAAAPARLDLVRAALRTFVHLQSAQESSERRGPLALGVEIAGELEPAHRQALVRARESYLRDSLPSELRELEAWRRSIDRALEIGREERIAFIVSALPLPPSLEERARSGGGLAAPLEVREILYALDEAIAAGRDAVRARRDLDRLADRILVEIDRLEPYLIGGLDREAVTGAVAYPGLLLRDERERLLDELQTAHSTVVENLEDRCRGEEKQLTRELRPRRDRLRDELLAALRSARERAVDGVRGFSLKSWARVLWAWRLGAAEVAWREIFGDPGGRDGADGDPGGLVRRQESARGEMVRAAAETRRQPGDPILERLAHEKRVRVEAVESELDVAWSRLEAALEEAEDLEALVWKLAGSERDADLEAAVDVGRLVSGSAEALRSRTTAAEVLEEKLRQVEGEIERLAGNGTEREELLDFLFGPKKAAGSAAFRAELEAAQAEVVAWREEIARLESDVHLLPEAAAVPIAGAAEPPRIRESREVAVAGRPLDTATATEDAIRKASEFGGDLALAGDDIEIAREELKRSGSRFLPEFFATLGANSNAPAVFQGGGFGLLTLSLDLLENRRFFDHQEEERTYLRELAELLVTMKALRAYALVASAEFREAIYRSACDHVSTLLDRAWRTPGADPSGDLWLSFARERLDGAVLEARAELAARRRRLNSLRGAPLDEVFSAGMTGVVSAGERLESWLLEAQDVLRSRFPEHPAFLALLAEMEKHGAREREARLKRTWPVLRAGGGLAAPSETIFSVGASLIFPVVDSSSKLGEETALADREVAGLKRELTLLDERRKREAAGLRYRGSSDGLAVAESLMGAHVEALRESLEDYRHGFHGDAVEIAAAVDAVVGLLSKSGGLLDTAVESGLEFVEAGGDLRETGRSRGSDAAGEAASPSSRSQAPFHAVRVEQKKVEAAEARSRREDHLIEKIGLGASLSYASLFIPLPSVELTYGTSRRRREAVEAGLRHARSRVDLVELEAKRRGLEAYLACLRDRSLERARERGHAVLEDYARLAERLQDRGLEPPRAAKLARARLLGYRAELEAARSERRRSEARRRWLVDGAWEWEFSGALGPTEKLSRDAVDRLVSPDTEFFSTYRARVVRRALESEVRYRWLDLVAKLENKRPYGGHVGDLVTPLWDLVRLWDRPGSREDVEAALARLEDFLLRVKDPEELAGPAEADLESLLDDVKDELGGDGYDAAEVAEALRRWRDARLRLELHDVEAGARRRAAHEEYGLRQRELERLERRRRHVEEDASVEAAAAYLGEIAPLRRLSLAEELADLAAERGRALHRYAAARAQQIYYGNELDAPPPPSDPDEEAVTLEELAAAYIRKDPTVRKARDLLASGREEAVLLEGQGFVRAALPTVVPSLGLDPRFAGSGLATSLSLFANVDRSRRLDEVLSEVAALSEERRAAEREAAMDSLKDAIRLRSARAKVESWRLELDARLKELVRRRDSLEAAEAGRYELARAERAVEEARWKLAQARAEERRARQRMASRSGGKTIRWGERDAGESGGSGEDPALPPERAMEEIGADPRARAMSARSEGARRSASWRTKQNWLGSPLELVASLGQTPDDAEVGGGGFLALPLRRLLGLDRTGVRIEEIKARKWQGRSGVLARGAAERVRELSSQLGESRELLSHLEREALLARLALDRDYFSSEAAPGERLASELAPILFLEAQWREERARASCAESRRELEGHLMASGRGAPALVPRAAGAFRREPAGPSFLCDLLAADIVRETTAAPRGGAFEVAAARERVNRVDEELAGVDRLTPEEVCARLGLAACLRVAVGVLEGAADADPSGARREAGARADEEDLLDQARALERAHEEDRRTLLGLAGARSLAERVEILRSRGGVRKGSKSRQVAPDIDRAWEDLRPRLAASPSVRVALRRALRQALEEERKESVALLDDLLMDRRRGSPAGRAPPGADAPLDWEALEAARLPALAELPRRERAAFQERFATLRSELADLRRARLLDSVARRSELHQARLRDRVRSIDAHGKFRRLYRELGSLLERLARRSPEALRGLALSFRKAQLTRAESRLKMLLAARGGEGPASPAGLRNRLLSALSDRLEGEASTMLDRLAELGKRLEDLRYARRREERTAMLEEDFIGKRLAEARALESAMAEMAAREELDRGLESFLAIPQVHWRLDEIAEMASEERLDQLKARRERMLDEVAGIQDSVPPPAVPPAARALRALERVLEMRGALPEVASRIEDVRASLNSLRRRTLRYRVALERHMEEGPTAWAQLTLEERRRSARNLIEELGALRESSTALEESWADLVERVEELGDGAGAKSSAALAWRRALRFAGKVVLLPTGVKGDGAMSLRERWREETLRGTMASRLAEMRERASALEVIPHILDRLTIDEASRRRRSARLLLEHFPESGERRDQFAALLDTAREASRLADVSWELQAFYQSERHSPAELRRLAANGGAREAAQLLGVEPQALGEHLERLAPGEVEIEYERISGVLESTMRRAAFQGGVSRSALKDFLANFSGANRGRFLEWVRAAGVLPPALPALLSELRDAQAELWKAEESARLKGYALGRVLDDARSALAWRTADREAEILRRQEVFKDLMPHLYEELRARGYSDPRGRLLSFPEIAARDLYKARKSLQAVAIIPRSGSRTDSAGKQGLTRFLDVQLHERAERAPGSGDGGAASPAAPDAETVAGALSRTYAGRDESFTMQQALHAMASLLLYLADWDERGLEKAEMLIRQQDLYRRRNDRGGGRAGQPRMFLARTGEVGDAALDAGSNAAVALAAQLHASVSGSLEFRELATEIVDDVLWPLVREATFAVSGDGRGLIVSSPLRAAALTLAALRNQALIARVLDESDDVLRYSDAADRLARWLIDECWTEDLGVFRHGEGPLDAAGHLLCLTVVAFEDRFDEARIRKAVDVLEERFGVQYVLEDLINRGAFHGNWLLEGPLEAYNRFVASPARRFGLGDLRRLEPSDSWIFLNHLLYDSSGGLLGFSVEADGLAATSARRSLDLTSTALGVWALHLLGRRVDAIAREGDAEEIERLAYRYAHELLRCTQADDRDPFSRGWSWNPSTRDVERNPRSVLYEGRLSIEPTCYWIFADSARRGLHPLLPRDFAKLREGSRASSLIGTAVAGGAGEKKLEDLGGSLRELREGLLAREKRLTALLETARGELERHRAFRRGERMAAGEERRPTLSFLLSLLWLEDQVGGRDEDLIRANADPKFPHVCRPYATALAIIQFSLAAGIGGEPRYLELAKRLWDGMQGLRRQDGSWADAYDMRTGRVLPGAENRATGPNSWMVLAGLHVFRASGDGDVLEEARQTLDWVLEYQDGDPAHGSFGALTLGEVPYPEAISTESNADALAAAWGAAQALGESDAEESDRYRTAAKRIARFLATKMWMPTQRMFATGSSRPGGKPRREDEWLDSQTWTLLALDATREAHGYEPGDYNGLATLESEGRVTRVTYREEELLGFAKVTLGPDAFWPEGVAGEVLASRIVGRSDRFLGDLAAARGPDGAMPHIIGEKGSDQWKFDFRAVAVDGTVWATWAEPELNFNPFRADGLDGRVPFRWRPEALGRMIEWESRAVRHLESLLEKMGSLRGRMRAMEEGVERLRKDVGQLSTKPERADPRLRAGR